MRTSAATKGSRKEAKTQGKPEGGLESSGGGRHGPVKAAWRKPSGDDMLQRLNDRNAHRSACALPLQPKGAHAKRRRRKEDRTRSSNHSAAIQTDESYQVSAPLLIPAGGEATRGRGGRTSAVLVLRTTYKAITIFVTLLMIEVQQATSSEIQCSSHPHPPAPSLARGRWGDRGRWGRPGRPSKSGMAQAIR